MTSFPDSVVDDDGNIHHVLKEPLGRGGQGIVLRTRSPHIAVKLIGKFAEDASSAESKQGASQSLWNQLTRVTGFKVAPHGVEQGDLRRRLEDVHILPLPDLHVAQPLAMLRDHVGYTMRILKGMVPIRSLIADPGETNLAEFYFSTGGLRRRLELLANTAAILSRIHAVPLVYADISPNNIFVSEQKDAHEVWLIDLDNLDYLSSNATGVHTPGFGAPEVVTGRASASTLSDSYAFAVLAFWVLAQVHPFLGEFVDEGGGDGEMDRKEHAFRGDIPWIEDTRTDSNHTSRGLPRHQVLSKPVRELFERTFEEGRVDRAKRPSMANWADVLRRAADRIVSCKACGSSFDVTAWNCPFCPDGQRPSFIHMQVNRWDPEIDDTGASAVSSHPVWHKILGVTQDSTVLRHVIEPVLADAEDLPAFRIRILRSGIAIEPLNGHEVHVVVGRRLLRIEHEAKLPMPTVGNEIYLHFGAMDRPHRMAVLRLEEGA